MAAPPANVIWSNDGSLLDLEQLRAFLNDAANQVFARLNDNNYTPVHTSVPGDFNEASFVGYSPVAPNFAAAFVNGASKAEIDSAVISWLFTAGVGTATVFGWYLTYDTGGGDVLVCASKFVLPVTLSPASPNLDRVVRLTAVSEL